MTKGFFYPLDLKGWVLLRKNHTVDKEHKTEISNVENLHDVLIPEEFPEGPLGSPIRSAQAVEGKSTPWEEGQQRSSAYVYADKDFHDGLPRKTPGAHPLHDEHDE